MLMQEPVFPEHRKLFEIKKIILRCLHYQKKKKRKILYIETSSLQRRLAIRTPKVFVQKYTLFFSGGRNPHYFASYLLNRVSPCNICKLLACTPWGVLCYCAAAESHMFRLHLSIFPSHNTLSDLQWRIRIIEVMVKNQTGSKCDSLESNTFEERLYKR